MYYGNYPRKVFFKSRMSNNGQNNECYKRMARRKLSRRLAFYAGALLTVFFVVVMPFLFTINEI